MKNCAGNSRQSYSVDHSATQPQLIDTSGPLSQLRLDEYSETTPTQRVPELRPSSAVPFHQSNVVLNYQQQSNIGSNMCQMGNINRKRSAKFLKSVGKNSFHKIFKFLEACSPFSIISPWIFPARYWYSTFFCMTSENYRCGQLARTSFQLLKNFPRSNMSQFLWIFLLMRTKHA